MEAVRWKFMSPPCAAKRAVLRRRCGGSNGRSRGSGKLTPSRAIARVVGIVKLAQAVWRSMPMCGDAVKAHAERARAAHLSIGKGRTRRLAQRLRLRHRDFDADGGFDLHI